MYHTICAFTNDFDNIGGGYIFVGVEEENGQTKCPVSGIPIESLDKIQKDIFILFVLFEFCLLVLLIPCQFLPFLERILYLCSVNNY